MWMLCPCILLKTITACHQKNIFGEANNSPSERFLYEKNNSHPEYTRLSVFGEELSSGSCSRGLFIVTSWFQGVLQSGDITEASLSTPVSERQQPGGDESRARERPLDSPCVSVCLSLYLSAEVMSENQARGESRHHEDSHHRLATSALSPQARRRKRKVKADPLKKRANNGAFMQP